MAGSPATIDKPLSISIRASHGKARKRLRQACTLENFVRIWSAVTNNLWLFSHRR